MPDEMVEKVARDAAKKMFFGLDPIDCHDDSDTYLVTFDTAVKHIAAALSAASAEPVARDPSRFSRLSPDERPVIRERPDPTLGFISTAEMLAAPSEAAIRADERAAKALDLIAKMAGNVVFNGKQRPISHEEHMRAWADIEATAIRARGET